MTEKDAYEKLQAAIGSLNLNLKCIVRGYTDGKFQTRFFTKDGGLIDQILIDEKWIEGGGSEELIPLLEGIEKRGAVSSGKTNSTNDDE